ncbi:MAG: aminomethyltransferase family protein [Acidobacteriota bacterium]|nr:aminomethyltransferase family protein [Acidobacteriota bacterium]
MSEVQIVPLRQLALHEIHRASGALMSEHNGWSVPASYGDELFEYAAVRESGNGLLDLSSRGRLLVKGSEAVAFLNGLITNDMKTLAENQWMPAVFPNVQGRLVASVRVIRTTADTAGKTVQPAFIIDTEPATHDRVFQTIQKFTLAGDFHVTDLTGETVLLSLQGRAAADKLKNILGPADLGIDVGSVTHIIWQNNPILIMRASHTAAGGFDLLVNNAYAEHVWQALLLAGVRPVGYDALEILRVEAGIPRYSQDMDEATVITETNLDDAVSYTKGCYVGQEIIARIKYRGHVAKKLRGLVFEKPAMVASGTSIKSKDDKDIGQVTSSAYSPHLGRRLALAYIKFDYIAAATEVKTSDGVPARVVDLPFVN